MPRLRDEAPGNNANALAQFMAKYAYREGRFTLSSGAVSDFYLDAKKVSYLPAGARMVGDQVLAIVREFGAEAVGGLTMGADAIVMSAVWASIDTPDPIPGFVVRKEPKKHGLQKWIEGVDPAGKRVAIVDDVITSGKSVLEAVKQAKAGGAEVVVVIGLVDREQGGAETIMREANVAFRALCSISDIRAAAALQPVSA
jgi:orotate phosphoribosyltransferase